MQLKVIVFLLLCLVLSAQTSSSFDWVKARTGFMKLERDFWRAQAEMLAVKSQLDVVHEQDKQECEKEGGTLIVDPELECKTK